MKIILSLICALAALGSAIAITPEDWAKLDDPNIQRMWQQTDQIVADYHAHMAVINAAQKPISTTITEVTPGHWAGNSSDGRHVDIYNNGMGRIDIQSR